MPYLTEEAIRAIQEYQPKTYWKRGVKEYALELIENIKNRGGEITLENALNGAENWAEYSWGGCSLIYNQDIAERLSTPTELKLTHNGKKDPNPRERWLDTQARALGQAYCLIAHA